MMTVRLRGGALKAETTRPEEGGRVPKFIYLLMRDRYGHT